MAISLLLVFLLGTKAQHISISDVGVVGNNKNLPRDLDLREIEEVYDTLKDDFDGSLDAKKLVEGVKAGLVDAAGDPYTNYLSANEATLLKTSLAGEFSGIGAVLGKVDDRPIIMSPIADYPAAKAGLKARDVILKINGADTAGMSLDEAVLKIRGDEGSVVTLELARGDERFTKQITRQTIKTPSVSHEIIEDGTIGYLRLTQFGEDTDQLADDAAQEFTSKGVKGIILDLRDNGGGLLPSSTHIAGMWLSNQVVVREKRDGKVRDELRGDGLAVFKGKPTVVLINGGTASASEIVAGALKDYDAATLVGEKTFGKGSVQLPTPLSGGGTIKVTIAHWFTPKDRSADKVGFKPDIEVQPGDGSSDQQKAKAIEVLKSKIK